MSQRLTTRRFSPRAAWWLERAEHFAATGAVCRAKIAFEIARNEGAGEVPLARWLNDLGRPDQAEIVLRRAADEALRAGDVDAFTSAATEFVHQLVEHGRRDEARRWLQRALGRSTETTAELLLACAVVARAEGRLDHALGLFRGSLSLFTERGCLDGRRRVLLELGVAYHARGRFRDALTCGWAAFRLAKRCGDPFAAARSLRLLEAAEVG